jgi:glycosyltransferase involved in cell wall biosynthesis
MKNVNINLVEFPLISVVVVTYNSSKTIVETLESIKSQTYPNIELIISDDASKDDTILKCWKWLADLAENESRFVSKKVVLAGVNLGIPANCNRGVKTSSGSYIKLIAGDDALFSTCLMDNFRYVEKRPDVDILLSQMEIFDTKFQSELSLGVWKSGALTDFFPDEISASQQYNMLLTNDRVGNTPTIFLRAGIFEKIGYFDEEFPWVEDYPFWLKATKAGIRINFMDLVTVQYRKHISSIHNNGNVQFMLPSYFLNERLREKYIYPNLSYRQRLYKKYGYNMALIFKFFTGNKYHPAVSKTYNFLTFQSNFYTRLFQS